MAKFIKVFNHERNEIDLTHLEIAAEIRPTELHYKEDGALDDKPSFVMVMIHPELSDFAVYGQFSLKTLEDCLRELDYELIKVNKN